MDLKDRMTGLIPDIDKNTLYKRVQFDWILEKEVYRAKRYGRILSLVIIQVKIKDDKEMERVSSLLKDMYLREVDLFFRFSKRSFAFILPETSKPRAIIVGERIKEEIETNLGKKDLVRIGIATYPYEANTKEELVREATRNLRLCRRHND